MTGGINGTVRVWNVASGELVWARPGHIGPVTDVSFSAGGDRFATAGGDRTAKLWSISERRVIEHAATVAG